MNSVINIAKQFSRSPAGRYVTDGPFSGQAFRENLLVPALNSADKVEVDMDGVMGFGSSFLEEAFGGLVRISGMNSATVHEKLKIKTRLKMYEQRVWLYVDKAVAEK